MPDYKFRCVSHCLLAIVTWNSSIFRENQECKNIFYQKTMLRTHFVSLHQILFHFYHGWILRVFEKTLRVFPNVCSSRMLGILLTSRRLVLRIAAAKRCRIHLTSTENNITMATWIVQVPWYSRIIALSVDEQKEREREISTETSTVMLRGDICHRRIDIILHQV